MKPLDFKLLILTQIVSLVVFAKFGEPVKQIETTKDGSGRIYVFALGNDGAVRYARQGDAGSGWCRNISIPMSEDSKKEDSWRKPSLFIFKQITTTHKKEGSIVVYGLDSYGNVYGNNQDINNIDTWHGWKLIGTGFSQIEGYKDNSNSLAGLKTIGTSVSYRFEKTNNLTTEPAWHGLGGSSFRQIVCEGTENTKYVFALRYDGSVQYMKGLKYSWSAWSGLEGTELKKIDVEKSANGRMHLFAIGGDNAIYERHEESPGGNWSAWTTLYGGAFKDIFSSLSNSGRVTVFGLHTDVAVDHVWENEPGSGSWSNWMTLGGDVLQSVKSIKRNDGRMVVFAIGGDGKVYYRWQAAPDDYWENWGCLSDMFQTANKLCETSTTGNTTGKTNPVRIIDRNLTPTQPVAPTASPEPPKPSDTPNPTKSAIPPAPAPDTALCSQSIDYWFFKRSPRWPDINGIANHNVKVAMNYYSEAEAKSIWNTTTQGINYGARMGFVVITTLRLSGVSPTLPVWKDVKAVENWLRSLNTKLAPGFLPDADIKMNDLIKKIDAWIKGNLCNK